MNDHPIKPDPAKKPKRPADANQRAKMIVDLATGENAIPDSNESSIGRAGGLIGGKKRAETLTPAQRRDIAWRAAKARWTTQESEQAKHRS